MKSPGAESDYFTLVRAPRSQFGWDETGLSETLLSPPGATDDEIQGCLYLRVETPSADSCTVEIDVIASYLGDRRWSIKTASPYTYADEYSWSDEELESAERWVDTQDLTHYVHVKGLNEFRDSRLQAAVAKCESTLEAYHDFLGTLRARASK